MPEFDETPAEIENEIKMSEYESLHSRKLNIPLSVLWEYLRRHPNLPPAEAAHWRTKFDGRLAAPWTCLVVVLIAIPVWRGVGPAQSVCRRGGQHFHLFHFLCAPASRPGAGHGRLFARVAGGLAAEPDFWRDRIVADGARAMNLISHNRE